MLKDSLKTIIENLVNDVNSVSIEETENDKFVLLKVKVAETDMGRVIGREGKIAKSIRTIMKSMGAKENKKVTVEFGE